MKIAPELKLADASWDRYRALHWGLNQHSVKLGDSWSKTSQFVAFETGEVIWAGGARPRPDKRGYYSTLGVSVLSPRDRDFPRILHLDTAEPICRSWLIAGCNSYLLLDHETGTVVGLGNLIDDKHVPTRFATYGSAAYFPGEGRVPLGGQITYSKPHSALPKDQRQHIEEIVKQCKAARAMAEASGQKTPGEYKHRYQPKPTTKQLLAANNYADLTADQRAVILIQGIARVSETVQSARFRP